MTYIHPTTIIETKNIGKKCKIWAFAHICEGAIVGDNCVVGEGVYIGPNVIIGNNCKIQNHSLIYEGVILEDNVFIGPNVITTNDINPRVDGDWKKNRFRKTLIKAGTSIGANTTIICGNTIGKNSLIGAGSLVTKNIPDNVVAFGHPAQVVRTNTKMNKTI